MRKYGGLGLYLFRSFYFGIKELLVPISNGGILNFDFRKVSDFIIFLASNLVGGHSLFFGLH